LAPRALALSALALSALALSACGPAYVRSGEDSDFEGAAMSTRLDKTDLERLFKGCSTDLFRSGLMKHWRALKRDGREGVLAVLPIVNETSEHIDGALQALLKKLETQLINEGDVAVVSRADQPLLLRELKTQQGDAFDPLRVAELGQQLGAQYLLTGRVYDITEKGDEGRRVQYFLFMQVVEVATGRVRWQISEETLKGLVGG
ncbi:MAG: penicillin-binding protein activator LpoB, partial [Deltaproteobacteria bacterium]|nr:penicillin-binding protein activator LpoB [Deltaproteobacteria bacterium]